MVWYLTGIPKSHEGAEALNKVKPTSILAKFGSNSIYFFFPILFQSFSRTLTFLQWRLWVAGVYAWAPKNLSTSICCRLGLVSWLQHRCMPLRTYISHCQSIIEQVDVVYHIRSCLSRSHLWLKPTSRSQSVAAASRTNSSRHFWLQRICLAVLHTNRLVYWKKMHGWNRLNPHGRTRMEALFFFTHDHRSMVFLNLPHEPRMNWLKAKQTRQCAVHYLHCISVCLESWSVALPLGKESKVRMLLKRLKMDPQNRQQQHLRLIRIPQWSNMWKTMVHIPGWISATLN